MTKEAFRASNKKDEVPQMTTHRERREKVEKHFAFVKWRQGIDQERSRILQPMGPPKPTAQHVKMVLHPTLKAVSFDDLAKKYGAVDFQDALADFIARINHPDASVAALRSLAANTLIPFRTVPVYHRIKFRLKGQSEVVDSILARPEQTDSRGRRVPSRFDTALIRGQHGMHGNNGKIKLY